MKMENGISIRDIVTEPDICRYILHKKTEGIYLRSFYVSFTYSINFTHLIYLLKCGKMFIAGCS